LTQFDITFVVDVLSLYKQRLYHLH